ncbi:glycosyltransferase family 4 protein [archaeon]|nr:glycosyltransferase family 4 protein [archaeon]
MRIAFVSDAVYPYHKGGKEKRIFEISTGLAKKGHDVHIYTMKWWKGPQIKKENGLTLHAISPYYKLYKKDGTRSITQALLFTAHLPKLISEKFDIIEVDHMPYFPIFPTWLISKIKRKPFFVTWHEYWGNYWFDYLGSKGIFGYIIENISAKLSTNINVVSRLTQRRLRKVTKNKMNYSPNGIDFNLIKKSKKKKSFDLLFAGRMIKEKNVSFLIDQVKSDYTLGIIGSGPELEKIKAKSKQYPNIEVLGMLPKIEDVYGYMKSAKLFAFPSEREGFGIAPLEAMACGTPTLVLKARDNASMYLVDKEFIATKENFKAKIDKFLKNPKKINFEIKNYFWENIINNLESNYMEALK